VSLPAAEWLKRAEGLAADFERHAVDRREGALARTAAFLEGIAVPAGAELFPWGLDEGRLWDPWRRAREAVERYPQDPQTAGAQADYILYDAGAGTVTLGKVGAWSPGCPRFEARACPRMAPMGHESPQQDCNYWSWAPMAAYAPDVELFPEWQRFDCSRYYPIFQLHLCGENLADLLEAEPRWVLHAPEEARKSLQGYAALTSRPEAFRFSPLPEP
jgi:hypothetical protein